MNDDLCPNCEASTLIVRTFKGDYPAPSRPALYRPHCGDWFQRDDEGKPGIRLKRSPSIPN